MTRLSDTQEHIASMDELLDIVGAMRSLAAIRMQEAQNALESIRRYSQSMAAAIGSALPLMQQGRYEAQLDTGCRAVILVTAEHGFVGGFNERLIQAAKSARRPDDTVFIMGTRGALMAAEHGLPAVWTSPMATRLSGAPDTINILANAVYTRIAHGEICRVDAIYGRYQQGAVPVIEQRSLLPLDTRSLPRAAPRLPPLHNLPARALVEKLIAEYIFALLTEVAIESIASENAARLSAMDSARDNVTKKLASLRQTAQQERQSEITSELLDLITGAEAIGDASQATAPRSIRA
jgi:F-type H+-transporting ATPase subunit gamma